jgi:hypothetical protein
MSKVIESRFLDGYTFSKAESYVEVFHPEFRISKNYTGKQMQKGCSRLLIQNNIIQMPMGREPFTIGAVFRIALAMSNVKLRRRFLKLMESLSFLGILFTQSIS